MAGNFRGNRPKGQPRTLRTIAEDKGTAPAGRDPGVEIDPRVGVPAGYPGGGAGQHYEDAADAAKPGTTSDTRPKGPKSY